MVDRDDNSISRTDAMYKDPADCLAWFYDCYNERAECQEIFRRAGLVLQHELKQVLVVAVWFHPCFYLRVSFSVARRIGLQIWFRSRCMR